MRGSSENPIVCFSIVDSFCLSAEAIEIRYCKGPTEHSVSLPLYPTAFTIRVVGSTSYQNVHPFIQGRQSTAVYLIRPDSSVCGGHLPSLKQTSLKGRPIQALRSSTNTRCRAS